MVNRLTKRYILVSDDEYYYILDTFAENYKTLEDFEKQEFEKAKKDGVDIKEYEEFIFESANDKYWGWVYDNHLEVDTVNDIMNELYDENKTLHEENQQLKQQLKDNEIEWLRNNTVWEQMPSNRRTKTITNNNEDIE